MNEVVLVGNGKTRDLYDPDLFAGVDTRVIGCNVPPKGIRVDHAACVDAKAVMLAYRPDGEPRSHHRLEEGEFTLVIGPRCAQGLRKTKSVPGGTQTMLEYLKEREFIYKKIPVFPDAFKIGQRYFSSGHLGFMFALEEYKARVFHFYGFDSFMTGNHSSYSAALRAHQGKDVPVMPDKRVDDRHDMNSPKNTVGAWFNLWQNILDHHKDDYDMIHIHGYEGDDIPDGFKQRKVELVCH